MTRPQDGLQEASRRVLATAAGRPLSDALDEQLAQRPRAAWSAGAEAIEGVEATFGGDDAAAPDVVQGVFEDGARHDAISINVRTGDVARIFSTLAMAILYAERWRRIHTWRASLPSISSSDRPHDSACALLMIEC